ncbi:MAG TPA: S-adenosylmethionine tRNA ribosyltransferase [Bacteroidetes bacterium]|nr:S-adenosylmethionine tRNA ribosyltransferase [Bacteroidota bacterium]
MQPRQIRIEDYSYQLPEERIAQYPLVERDTSRLLVYRGGNISEKIFNQLSEILPAETLLVFNDTKVIHARMFFTTQSNATIEVFCLEPVSPVTDLRLAIFTHEPTVWRCLVGNAKRWKETEVLEKRISLGSAGTEILLKVFLEKREDETFLVRFEWNNAEISFASVIEAAGLVPLPPYMKRSADRKDDSTYQTIYGHQDGSVAAPTAGLHFTEKVFQSLKEKNISPAFLTLHVGAGTFRTVKSKTLENHPMHGERIYVNRDFILRLLEQVKNKKPIAAVGTTSLRTIESIHWFGVKLIGGDKSFELQQWEVYDSLMEKNISTEKSLRALLNFLDEENKNEFSAYTHLLCAPSYQFQLCEILLTNFHLSQSTLLLLVAAFVGDDWKKIYDYALENRFRFLSYGDSSILFRKM